MIFKIPNRFFKDSLKTIGTEDNSVDQSFKEEVPLKCKVHVASLSVFCYGKGRAIERHIIRFKKETVCVYVGKQANST